MRIRSCRSNFAHVDLTEQSQQRAEGTQAQFQAQSVPVITGTVDAETLELLQRRNQVRKQILTLNKDCGVAFYRPHWLQHRFHTSTSKRRGAFAGNRFGKSQCNAAETCAWMLGERPWYKVPFPIYGVDHDRGKNRIRVLKELHPGGENHPYVRSGIPPWPTKQIIVCTNWDKVHEIWTSQEGARPGKIWQFLPKGFAKANRNHEGVIDEIYGANGSFLKFMSVDAFKRNKFTAESSDWDRAGFDEPGPQALWKGLARGLVDRKGQGDFTLTSLEELWIYEYFNIDELPVDTPDICKDRFAITATIFDNPHLSDDAIAMFMADLTEDEQQCRLFGIPLELSGLVYKEFNKERHVLARVPDGWEDYYLPPKDLLLYCRVDTHPVKEHAVSFFALGPAEYPVQCHEIWKHGDGHDLAGWIRDYLKLTGCYLASLKVEPAAWVKDQTTKRVPIAEVLAEYDLFPRRASKDLATGIMQVKSALRKNQLFFSPLCKKTLWEFARYRYDPEKGEIVDENDHFMENLYRLVIDKPRYFSPDSADDRPIGDMEIPPANLSPVL